MTLPARRDIGSTLWSPFRELEELRERMNTLWTHGFAGALEDVWSPMVDIEETDDAYLIEIDLPGVKKDDISVEIEGGELAVHGEIKEKERTGVMRSRMRRTGRFDYRTTLPRDIDTDHVQADLSNGVLTLKLPKAEEAKPRRIEISS
ncbi:heat-shock protein Hsp20 [Streptomyces sp. F-3]|jgi:HSP20 family protein|uniref:Hsp20/alpha crystallin family protein n=1 Tax=Streptomyces thermogriseus TaxID=75292 RepID=A0ABN1T612_9ACTN|nr:MULTISPECIES: Hsp20/alpha crystallin family protein [Streptomyces]MDN5384831.1 Hsp20/alpha crystallin family protein [Streptomyces sp. LB8]GAT84992.1 heat-shock protein Hsp20 [Streptomyces sp. F-3]